MIFNSEKLERIPQMRLSEGVPLFLIIYFKSRNLIKDFNPLLFWGTDRLRTAPINFSANKRFVADESKTRITGKLTFASAQFFLWTADRSIFGRTDLITISLDTHSARREINFFVYRTRYPTSGFLWCEFKKFLIWNFLKSEINLNPHELDRFTPSHARCAENCGSAVT